MRSPFFRDWLWIDSYRRYSTEFTRRAILGIDAQFPSFSTPLCLLRVELRASRELSGNGGGSRQVDRRTRHRTSLWRRTRWLDGRHGRCRARGERPRDWRDASIPEDRKSV